MYDGSSSNNRASEIVAALSQDARFQFKDQACISHIKVLQENSDDNSAIYSDEHLRQNAVGILEVGENYVKIKTTSQAGHRNPGSGGKRGNVTQFSHGSRTRMIQRMASLPVYPRIWQDFTFADDTMRGLTESERAAFSSECVRKFRKILKSAYRGRLWGIWRREWERRGSGSLTGQQCPHFHVLLDVPGFNEATYRKLCLTLATLWVKITGTQHPKAGSVARHEKSYRWLKSVRMAQIYVAKCTSKVEVHKGTTASLGRFWGRIGTPPEPILDTHYLSAPENILIRRLLRAYAGRRSTHLKRILQTQTAGCWVLISRSTINRMMAWVRENLADHPAHR